MLKIANCYYIMQWKTVFVMKHSRYTWHKTILAFKEAVWLDSLAEREAMALHVTSAGCCPHMHPASMKRFREKENSEVLLTVTGRTCDAIGTTRIRAIYGYLWPSLIAIYFLSSLFPTLPLVSTRIGIFYKGYKITSSSLDVAKCRTAVHFRYLVQNTHYIAIYVASKHKSRPCPVHL